MIGVEEAKRLMMAAVRRLPSERRVLDDLSGRYAAADVVSPNDHPLFDMSAVDGYAFGFDEASERTLMGEVAAGEVFEGTLRPGECVRIFTGAMVPDGADTVVMQEFTTREDRSIRHQDVRLKRGANVRLRGEHVRAGEVILSSGGALNASTVGLLASVGIDTVEVARRPKLAVMITGGEFRSGDAPQAGKIFNSNDRMLATALDAAGCPPHIFHCADQRVELALRMEAAAAEADLVITTGGASVGDHDLIAMVLADLGATVHFHGVAQKPGKPMLFATLKDKPVFGLPGNPRAVMVLFWEYVLPFVRALQGAKEPWSRSDRLPIAQDVEVKGERAEFRAARVKDGKVTLLKDEGSHMLRSLIGADALAYLQADRRSWKTGDLVEVHYLP